MIRSKLKICILRHLFHEKISIQYIRFRELPIVPTFFLFYSFIFLCKKPSVFALENKCVGKDTVICFCTNGHYDPGPLIGTKYMYQHA
jgi:hypothetical protein